MDIDPEVLKNIMNDNSEFKVLYDQHSRLKSQVEKLNKLKLITSEQEVKKKLYQKEKLLMKDQLEKILKEHQGN
jgi:uncharacterized protein YdcH (DUF465 family)